MAEKTTPSSHEKHFKIWSFVLGSLGDLMSLLIALEELQKLDPTIDVKEMAHSGSTRTDQAMDRFGRKGWSLKRFVENLDFAAASERNRLRQAVFFFAILREMPQLIHSSIDYLLENGYFDPAEQDEVKIVLSSLSAWAFLFPLLHALGVNHINIGVAGGIDERAAGNGQDIEGEPPFLLDNEKTTQEHGLAETHRRAKDQFNLIFTRRIAWRTGKILKKMAKERKDNRLWNPEVEKRLGEVMKRGLDPTYAQGTVYASGARKEGGIQRIDDGHESGSPLKRVNRTAAPETTAQDAELQAQLESPNVRRVIVFSSGSMVIPADKLEARIRFAQEKISTTPGMEDVLLVYVNAHGDKKNLPQLPQFYATKQAVDLDWLLSNEKIVGAISHSGAGSSAMYSKYGIPVVAHRHTDEQLIQAKLNHKALNMPELDALTKHDGDVKPEDFWEAVQTLLKYPRDTQRGIPLGNKDLGQAVWEIMQRG